MKFELSTHASIRQQQRGVPPLISDWLISYGDEQFDGRGGIIRFFSKQGIRRLEKDVGRDPIKRLSEFMRCYLVQSSKDGVVITQGKRYANRHILRC